MKRTILTCEQGGAAWMRARCGLPTASRFGAIVTPSYKATANAERRTYLAELVCEQLTGSTTRHFITAAMQRGTESESMARAWYAFDQGVMVEQVGMVLLDDACWSCGASPDGLVGDEGGIEIKVPMPTNLISAVMSDAPPSEYLAQIQGCMWVTGRKWWDLVLYGPEAGLPTRVWRIKADANYHAALAVNVPLFYAEVRVAVERIKETCFISNAVMRDQLEDAIDPTANWGKDGDK